MNGLAHHISRHGRGWPWNLHGVQCHRIAGCHPDPEVPDSSWQEKNLRQLFQDFAWFWWLIWSEKKTLDISQKKNGKRGMLGHPSVYFWLLWFLCFCSMFHLYLWCFFLWGFWDFFARTFTSLFGFRWGGDLLLLLCFFENGFVLELSLLNTSFVVFDFSLQM